MWSKSRGGGSERRPGGGSAVREVVGEKAVLGELQPRAVQVHSSSGSKV